MNLIPRFLRFFFHHLYHGLAFTYDLVAATVSFGQWTEWTKATLPFIEGTRLLELGHGPGHLQRLFPEMGLLAVGLDESAQMGRLARARLIRNRAPVNLTRGLAQNLPFPPAAFDSIISTFPSEYIYDARTLAEVRRALRSRGRLIVLPAAWPSNRLLGWLFKVTGESPTAVAELIKDKMGQPFIRAGFETEVRTLEVKSGVLIIVIAEKPLEGS